MESGVSFTYTPVAFSFGLGLSAAAQRDVPTDVFEFTSALDDKDKLIDAVDAHGQQLLRSRIEATVAAPEPVPAEEQEAIQPTEEAPSRAELEEFIELPVAEKEEKAPNTSTELSEDALAQLGRKPYWMRWCKRIRSPFLRLHQEIVELVELLQPTDEEVENRKQAVADVTAVVQSIWPSARVQVFGSFATGLFVPTSDIDVVVINSECSNIQEGLKGLASVLMRKQVAKTIQVIAKARVPIIKFETAGWGGLNFDVSFDVANGPEAAKLVYEFTAQWPMMRPLVLILKLFLQQRELNEVYSGGIGSYALITLVAAFLKLHTSRKPKGDRTPASEGRKRSKASKQPVASLLEPSLGVLLVDFFRLFGRVINMPEVGVSATDAGCFFRKDDKLNPDTGTTWLNYDRPHLLSVEDPKDETNDVCKSSYNVRLAKAAFDFAYSQLTAPSRPDESMLARILRLGPILVSRNPPANPRDLYKRPPPKFGDDSDGDNGPDNDGGGGDGNGGGGGNSGGGDRNGDGDGGGGGGNGGGDGDGRSKSRGRDRNGGESHKKRKRSRHRSEDRDRSRSQGRDREGSQGRDGRKQRGGASGEEYGNESDMSLGQSTSSGGDSMGWNRPSCSESSSQSPSSSDGGCLERSFGRGGGDDSDGERVDGERGRFGKGEADWSPKGFTFMPPRSNVSACVGGEWPAVVEEGRARYGTVQDGGEGGSRGEAQRVESMDISGGSRREEEQNNVHEEVVVEDEPVITVVDDPAQGVLPGAEVVVVDRGDVTGVEVVEREEGEEEEDTDAARVLEVQAWAARLLDSKQQREKEQQRLCSASQLSVPTTLQAPGQSLLQQPSPHLPAQSLLQQPSLPCRSLLQPPSLPTQALLQQPSLPAPGQSLLQPAPPAQSLISSGQQSLMLQTQLPGFGISNQQQSIRPQQSNGMGMQQQGSINPPMGMQQQGSINPPQTVSHATSSTGDAWGASMQQPMQNSMEQTAHADMLQAMAMAPLLMQGMPGPWGGPLPPLHPFDPIFDPILAAGLFPDLMLPMPNLAMMMANAANLSPQSQAHLPNQLPQQHSAPCPPAQT